MDNSPSKIQFKRIETSQLKRLRDGVPADKKTYGDLFDFHGKKIHQMMKDIRKERDANMKNFSYKAGMMHDQALKAYASWYRKQKSLKKESTMKFAQFTQLDEARRGRPRKQPEEPQYDEDGERIYTENETDQNIMMQLRKSVSLRGQKEVVFRNGDKYKVPFNQAKAAIAKFNDQRTSIQKGDVQKKLGKSKQSFLDTIKENYTPELMLQDFNEDREHFIESMSPVEPVHEIQYRDPAGPTAENPYVLIWDRSKSSYDGEGIIGMMNLSTALKIYGGNRRNDQKGVIDELKNLKKGTRMKIGSKWFQLNN